MQIAAAGVRVRVIEGLERAAPRRIERVREVLTLVAVRDEHIASRRGRIVPQELNDDSVCRALR
jgi:hypothetical protein